MTVRTPLTRCHLAALLATLGALSACSQTSPVPVESLSGPRAIALVRGDVCMSAVEVAELVEAPQPRACNEGERGAIALTVNTNANRVGVINLNTRSPNQLDLDASTPGITHLTVGKGPMDAASGHDGTTAFVLNQQSRDVSVLNMWRLNTLSATLRLPGPPIKLTARQDRPGIAVAIADPPQLWVHPGVTCAQPSDLSADRRLADADAGCEGADEAGATLSLPGAPVDLVSAPDRGLTYVIYADRPFMSVLAMDEDALADRACLSGGQVPCEVQRIGLFTGCSDGVDNDGDGLIDQADPQCYGPRGAESAEGISRRFADACADGVDNDGDGLTDRDDPECLASEGASEETPLANPAPVPTCDDGVDNDGDGLTDALDPDCYGAQGGNEAPARPLTGLQALTVDELGLLAYVVDAPRDQVLVVDLRRGVVIDAPRAASPAGDAFSGTLGVGVGRTPTAATGRLRRTVVMDPSDPEGRHALIRYDYGAYVATDNGFIYYVDALVTFCDVYEPAGVMTKAEFFRDHARRAASQERLCLEPVALPQAEPASAVVPSCAQVFLCQACVEAGDASCADCQNIDEATRPEQLATCQLTERRDSLGLVRRTVNPRFGLRDQLTLASGRQLGRATCVIPEAMIPALDQANNASGAPTPLDCGNAQLPQPLSITVPTRGAARPTTFLDSRRFDLLERRTLSMELNASLDYRASEIVDIETFDQRLRDEVWTIEYEGVLPSTRRDDGLVDADDPSRFDTGALDLCAAGVRVGDQLTITSAPGAGDGAIPADCQRYVGDADDFLTYSIIARTADGVTLAPLTGDGARFVGELPTRACFPRGLSFEIRPSQEWLVSGESSGAISDQVAVAGQCVPAYGAEQARLASRVRTGEVFHGPYMSFTMWSGSVAPQRGLRFQAQVQRNFTFSSTESGLQLNPNTKNPRQIVHADDLPNGRYILIPDPSDDVIFIKNLSNSDSAYYLR